MLFFFKHLVAATFVWVMCSQAVVSKGSSQVMFLYTGMACHLGKKGFWVGLHGLGWATQVCTYPQIYNIFPTCPCCLEVFVFVPCACLNCYWQLFILKLALLVASVGTKWCREQPAFAKGCPLQKGHLWEKGSFLATNPWAKGIPWAKGLHVLQEAEGLEAGGSPWQP